MKFALPKKYDSLAKAIVGIYGQGVSVQQAERVSGGDINKAYALYLTNGERVFMKANEKSNEPFFVAEAASLCAIAMTNTIGTPKILCVGTDPGQEVGYSFLLLDFIQSAKPRDDYWEAFGRELAAMHSADTSAFFDQEQAQEARFGFFQDNFIGSRPQANAPQKSWISFFRDSRLAPQFKAADHYFDGQDRARVARLLDRLDGLLVEPEKPSLLHGDLWSGNAMRGPDGKAILIDPASYVGHAEADLAMTELFGGFAPEFYKAYKQARPLQPGYERRRDLYNLYHILNHLNIFGKSYLDAALSIVAEYAD